MSRLKKYIKNLQDPKIKSKRDAKNKAGYSPKTHTDQIEKTEKYQRLVESLMPKEDILNVIKASFKAMSPKNTPDHYARLKGADMGAKIHGMYKHSDEEPIKPPTVMNIILPNGYKVNK